MPPLIDPGFAARAVAFFVLLQASGSRRDAMLSQVSRQFGGQPMAQGAALRAADLFLPGEALLSAQGEAQIVRLARRFAQAPAVEIRSQGADPRRQRFDEWDLAAARLGAVARGVAESVQHYASTAPAVLRVLLSRRLGAPRQDGAVVDMASEGDVLFRQGDRGRSAYLVIDSS